MNYFQISIFLLQGTLVSLLIIWLFHLRKILGIGILFACLGLFQFMQVFLSSTVYVEVANGLLVSPGSAVLFTATLFAVLIIYIKEDASETRKIIYALLITNVVMALLVQSFSWNIADLSTHNPFNVTTTLFDNNALVLLLGTVVLFLDAILIIVLYEFISRHISSLIIQIGLTMLLVVSFDTIVFSCLAFSGFENLSSIVVSGLISKAFFVVFYSIIFSIYLKYFDKKQLNSEAIKIKDVFKPLTYRQKFEMARVEAIETSEKAKLNEIKYQTLTNISPVGIFHTRKDGHTTFVNPKWCEISGLTFEEAIGNGWLDAVHPDDVDHITKEWKSATAEKRVSEIEYRFLFSDSSIKWVLGRAVPELNLNNEIIGYAGTITEITDLKVIQQEQITLRKKAEESDRLKSAFLANMSHEIRTPMNGILGFSNLLKEPQLSGEKQQKYIQLIEKSGERMLNLITDIVNISKIESGILEVQLSDMNINEQLNFVHDSLKFDADYKKLTLTLNCELPDNVAVIQTDSEKFYGVISNLVKNSIKYTESGTIEFGYSHKGGEIEFYVKDTGIGIEEERQGAIFERFIQADIADKMARQGVGLGLTISRAYVELLGGKIWLESEVGIGSTFYFTIPNRFVLKRPVSTPKSMETTINEKLLASEFPKLKILVAEDDATSELLMSIELKKITSEILQVSSGTEAIEACRKTPDIDLILMDLQMPDKNGYEATREIRKFNKKIIIIAQTAFGLSGDREKALEAGCNDYITKPINQEELLTLLHSYFKK